MKTIILIILGVLLISVIVRAIWVNSVKTNYSDSESETDIDYNVPEDESLPIQEGFDQKFDPSTVVIEVENATETPVEVVESFDDDETPQLD